MKNNTDFPAKILFIPIILAAVFFAFYGAGKSLWLDEAYSVFVSGQNLSAIVPMLRSDTHPPLYYFLLWIWIKIFGSAEFAARAFSGAFYLLSVAAIYLTGRRIYENRTGLLAAFLYALSPLATGTAQSVRMYSLLGFFSVLSLFLFARYFIQTDQRRFVFWAFVSINALGALTHIWFFFLIAAEILAYLILIYPKSRSAAVRILLLSLAPFVVLWLPVLLAQMRNNPIVWLQNPGFSELLTILLGFYGERIALVVYPVAALLVILSLHIWSRAQRRENLINLKQFLADKRTLAFALIFWSAILIPFLISQFKPVFGQTRYAIVALPAFVLLLASLLSRFVKTAWLVVFCVLMLGFVGFAFVRYHNRTEPCSDRNMTAILLADAAENDVLIFTSLSRLPTEYYLRRGGAEDKFVRFTFPREIESHPGWRNEEKMLVNRAALEQEAENLITDLKQLSSEKPRRIWLFYGLDRAVSDILKQKLDAQFVLETRIDASCAGLSGKPSELFYTEIAAYKSN